MHLLPSSQIKLPAMAVALVAIALGLFTSHAQADTFSLGSAGGGGRVPKPQTPASTYMVDDGTAENAIGLTNGGDVIALNGFAVSAGNNIITNIQIAFGSPGGAGINLNGTSFTAVLWSDPNGDGLPGDAAVLATAPGIISGFATNTFVNVSIAPTVVLTPNFFVGFLITHPAGAFPAALDQTAPTFSNVSFIAGGAAGSGNINNLNANGLPVTSIESVGFPGNWLIRADAVPEPSTFALIGLGIAVVGSRLRSIRTAKK